MKKLFALFLVLAISFSFVSCSSENKEEVTTKEYSPSIPIVTVGIEEDNNDEYRALTKDGSFVWTETYADGNEKTFEYNGEFCLDDENLCVFTRKQVGESIAPDIANSIISCKVYCAPKKEIEDNKIKIYDEKYLVSSNSKIISFPKTGEYYYVLKINYPQGEIAYGFLLAE